MTPGRVWAFHAHWFDSYVRAAQECPGWHRIQRGTRKNIDPACQGAQTVFCTPHTPRICHAELIPMGLQHSPRYVVHHLPDDALTGSISWPAPRYCIGYLNSLGRLLPPVHLDTNDLLSVVLTVQFDGCMFSIRQIHIHDRRPRFVLYITKQNIMHFMMFMYIMYIMHIMHIMQDAPWTASQHRALASFLRVCIIMLFCTAGPWLVLPPCCFIQFLWASSAASTSMLSVSPQRAMSFGACWMLCIFSVSQMKLSSLFLYGKSCAHLQMNLLRTKWSNTTDYAICAYYAIYTVYAY